MSNPLKILSTKVLSPIQKNRMIELGARYTERNFIETKAIPFTYSDAKHSSNLVARGNACRCR